MERERTNKKERGRIKGKKKEKGQWSKQGHFDLYFILSWGYFDKYDLLVQYHV